MFQTICIKNRQWLELNGVSRNLSLIISKIVGLFLTNRYERMVDLKRKAHPITLLSYFYSKWVRNCLWCSFSNNGGPFVHYNNRICNQHTHKQTHSKCYNPKEISTYDCHLLNLRCGSCCLFKSFICVFRLLHERFICSTLALWTKF